MQLKLKNHVFKMNGKTCLDETAQELLKPGSGNAQLVDKVKRLEDEIVKQKAETEKWLNEYKSGTQIERSGVLSKPLLDGI